MNRLTTDNPKTNTETLLNFAFDKENKIYLRESEEGVELCKHVAGLCSGYAGGISEEDIMDGACMDCRGCSAGTLYFCAVQAAELRARLKAYEDTGLTPEEVKLMARREEWEPMVQITRIHDVPLNRLERLAQAEAEGRLIVLPCKVGDMVYYLTGGNSSHSQHFSVVEESVCTGIFVEDGKMLIRLRYNWKGNHGSYGVFGKTVFTSREAAEAALKEAQQE